MESKIKWGVLGTAGIAAGCTIPGMKLAQNVDLYAIAGRDINKAQSFKERFGFTKAYGSYEALLADEEVEAVYIPLPNHLHYEWIMKAIDAGKNVLCEKPMAPSAAEAQELFEAAKAKGVFLMEAFAYLHSPYVPELKKDIESGIIGDIRYIESAFIISDYDRDDIRLHKSMYGGATYDLGCYCTSLILSLLGKEPTQVWGTAEFGKDDVDVMSSIMLKFDNDVRATYRVGMIFEPGMSRRMDRTYIHGSKGCIKSDIEYNQSGNLSYTIYTTNQDGTVEEIQRNFEAPQNYALETQQLSRCIMGYETPLITGEFTVMNARLLDRILEAIEY